MGNLKKAADAKILQRIKMAIKEKINRLKGRGKEFQKEIEKRTISYIMAAFGLIAALAWNDAIKSMIDRFFPLPNEGLKAKFIYAVIITIIAVMISVYLVKFFEDEEQKK